MSSFYRRKGMKKVQNSNASNMKMCKRLNLFYVKYLEKCTLYPILPHTYCKTMWKNV